MEAADVSSDHSYNIHDGSDLATGDGDTTDNTGKSSQKDNYESGKTIDDKHDRHIEPRGNVTDGTVNDVCPFVCGMCSEKFDKSDLFHAHLKTHGKLIGEPLAQAGKEKNVSGTLKNKRKMDDDDFKCGICQVKFPSMSLLHEHMVGEENVSDYSYSNADHTARPDTRIVKSKNDSDTDTEEVQETASSSRGEVSCKGAKKKAVNLSTSGSQTSGKRERSKLNNRPKNSTSNDGIGQKKLVKSVSRMKRKIEEIDESQKKRKTKNDSEIRNIVPVSDVEKSPVIHTYGTRGNLSPRSSRRSSGKRVDYKALAGLSSSKYDSEGGKEDVSETPAINKEETSITAEKENNNRKIKRQLKDETNVDSDTEDLEKEKKLVEEKTMKKTVFVKVLSKHKIKTFKKKEITTDENTEKSSDLTERKDGDKTSDNDSEEVGEFNIKVENDAELEEFTVKADGTSADADIVYSECDSDYEINVSDHDSDDDFLDVGNSDDLDDEQNDPDFEPQLETENEARDGVIVSINDTRDPEAYLKKFKVKKRRIYKNNEGQPVKNCLYPCAVCGRYYLWKALKKHMYAHVTERVVKCTQCGRSYKSNRHLKDHIRSVHEMKKYGCPQCSSILKGNQSFEKHIMTHILKKEITEALDEVEKVEVSEEEYIKWKELQDNKITKYPPKKKKPKPREIKVKVDGLDLETLKEGPLHGQHIVLESDSVGTSRNQDCTICNKHFMTHESLLTHMIEHKDEEYYNCNMCNGFFQTPAHLQNHMLTVHGERDLECDICGEHLRSHYALWSHKGKHLMKKDPYYSEEIVQKLQEEIAERKRYKRKSVTDPKNDTRACEICGMTVWTVRYRRHLEVHNTTKDWECDICHNFYKTRRYLIDHKKKTHFAEMFSCDICGQRFKGKTYLEIHRQTHGPKDKKCPHCEKGFTTMMYLKTHLLTHEEKKRFRCEKCMAAFSHKQRLTIHMVEVHGEGASRPCKYCGDLFPSRQKARRHERVAHEGFVMPTRVKKRPNYVSVLKVSETENESLQHKIVRLMPCGSEFVTVSPGVVKIPVSKNNTITNDVQNSVANKMTADSSRVGAVADTGQYIKLENGDEYQVMIEKDGGRQSLEFVELSEEEQSVIIREADGAISQTTPMEQEENIEQVLEIPENAEQCQILLYPDGSFKLLNVVDNTTSS